LGTIEKREFNREGRVNLPSGPIPCENCKGGTDRENFTAQKKGTIYQKVWLWRGEEGGSMEGGSSRALVGRDLIRKRKKEATPSRGK